MTSAFNSFFAGLNAFNDSAHNARGGINPLDIRHFVYDPIQISIHGVLLIQWRSPFGIHSGDIMQTIQLTPKLVPREGLVNILVTAFGGGDSPATKRIGLRWIDAVGYGGIDLDDKFFDHPNWNLLTGFPYTDEEPQPPDTLFWSGSFAPRSGPEIADIGFSWTPSMVASFPNAPLPVVPHDDAPIPPEGISITDPREIPDSVAALSDTYVWALWKVSTPGTYWFADGTKVEFASPKAVFKHRGEPIERITSLMELEEPIDTSLNFFQLGGSDLDKQHQRWNVYTFFVIEY